MSRSTFLCAAVVVLLGLVEAQTADAQSFLVQVNTDALGHDILGDAANEPSIAVDPTDPNRMVIGWRQFDTITSNFRQAGVAYSHDGGLTWTASVLDPGQFRSDPVLRPDADGNFYYASLTSESSGDMFKSVDGGVTWLPPVYAYTGDKEWIAVDRTSGPGRGNVYQDWNVQFSPVPNTSFTRSTNGASSFEPPLTGVYPYIKWGTMDVGPNGTLYLAGATLDGTGFLFSKSTNAQYSSQTPAFSATMGISLGGTIAYGGINPGGLEGQVWIATDHSHTSSQGNIYVLGSVDPPGSDPLNVMFIRSTDDGATWSFPVRINNDPTGTNAYQWFGTMSVAPDGRIDAVWNDTRNDPTHTFSELYYAYSLDAGLTWLGNTPISAPFNSSLGYPSQNKIGDYYDMVSDNFGVNIAFAATFTGGQDVYYLRLPAVPEPSTWAVNTDGKWFTPDNWIGEAPSGPRTTARFTGATTATVIVDNPVTVGRILFDPGITGTNYTLSGSAITLDNSGVTSDGASIEVVSGSHTIDSPVILNDNASITGTEILNLSGGISGDHTLTVLGSISTSRIQVNTLIVGSAGVLIIGRAGALQTVPEPSTLLLLGVGTIGLLGCAGRWRPHRA